MPVCIFDRSLPDRLSVRLAANFALRFVPEGPGGLVLRPSWEKNPCVTLFVVIRQRGVSSEDLLGDELQALVFLTEVAERLSGLGHCPDLTVSALQIL